MEKFTKMTAIAAPLPIANVDTDMIIPKQFLKTIKRTGLGANLFDEMRFNPDGSEIKDFILNREPYRKAGILISGSNFGCGSSREHAPWALADFGIKCVIAPSFADIFYNNSFKNGILLITLPKEDIDNLVEYTTINPNPIVTVNLLENKITCDNSNSAKEFNFVIDANNKKCLLEGLDDIGITLQKNDKIANFITRHKEKLPWLY